jgi:hypothetical protein
LEVSFALQQHVNHETVSRLAKDDHYVAQNLYFSEDRREAMQEYRDLIASVPERAPMTLKGLEDLKLFQAKNTNFLDLIDDGWFTGFLTEEEDQAFGSELMQLRDVLKRKIEQHSLDLSQANTKLQRRSLWDLVLFRRLLEFFQ